jgi:hypothetical protein
MPEQISYENGLKQELAGLIQKLDLDDLKKEFIRSRWLDQVLWMEGRANHARDWYYRLRLCTIIGGLIVPALVSLSASGRAGPSIIRWVTFGLSLLVAASAAVEEFFHYGERWRHYRRTVELLKIEGWLFFQSSGPYSGKSHAEAYPSFAARVEKTIQHDVDVYVTQVVQEQKEREKQEGGNP